MENQEEQRQPQYNGDLKEGMDMRIVYFFVRIVRTVFLFLFWGIINVMLGLYLGFAIPAESTPGRMLFFYSFSVITLGIYIYIVVKIWRKHERVMDNNY